MLKNKNKITMMTKKKIFLLHIKKSQSKKKIINKNNMKRKIELIKVKKRIISNLKKNKTKMKMMIIEMKMK